MLVLKKMFDLFSMYKRLKDNFVGAWDTSVTFYNFK